MAPGPVDEGVKMPKIIFLLRLISSIILLQTLYFKFTGAPESVFIFETLGMEPWGRWGAGFSELIAGILLLIPGYYMLGALFALAIISGAILSHIFVLGIVIQNDGGSLFMLALVVFICCAFVIFFERQTLLNKVKIVLNKQT
jgi:uncharacterized membrane protein YphA (DoxX/SURF4 family)